MKVQIAKYTKPIIIYTVTDSKEKHTVDIAVPYETSAFPYGAAYAVCMARKVLKDDNAFLIDETTRLVSLEFYDIIESTYKANC